MLRGQRLTVTARHIGGFINLLGGALLLYDVLYFRAGAGCQPGARPCVTAPELCVQTKKVPSHHTRAHAHSHGCVRRRRSVKLVQPEPPASGISAFSLLNLDR